MLRPETFWDDPRTVIKHSVKICTVFPQGIGRRRHGIDLRFVSPQPDASLHYKTTDTELVHHGVCLLIYEYVYLPIRQTSNTKKTVK